MNLLIIALFFRSSPSAIVRAVMPMDVNAINGVHLAGGSAHISEKSSVVVDPTLAYLYASRSVMAVLGVVRVVAARLRMCPSFVFLAEYIHVLGKPLSVFVVSQASTAFGVASLKRIHQLQNMLSAVALAKPLRPISFDRWASTKDYDSPIAAPSYI